MTADDRELLIRIDTKLTVVCGEKGDGGVLAEHGTRIRALETESARRSGQKTVLQWALNVGGRALLAAASALAGAVFGAHTHR